MFTVFLFGLVLTAYAAKPPQGKLKGDENVLDNIFKINEINANKDSFSKKIKEELFEGDIVWSKKLKEQIDEMRERSEAGVDAFDAATRGAWPRARVPYTYARGFRYGSAVQQAISEYNAKTCIRFVKYTREEARRAGGYIEFMHGGGCYSMIGRQGGKQQVSLGNGCGTKGVAIHEMMHALGFFHEQSRGDRDSYITIHWNNIRKAMWYNFQKYKPGQASTLSESYDKQSIMHYGNYAFSINGRQTISSKSGNERLGQRNGLSRIDINQLRKMYKCSGGGGVRPTSPTKSCTDTYAFCPEISTRWCSNNWLKANCKKRCNLCSKPTKTCHDKNNNCSGWAKRGFCTHSRYGGYMAGNCKKSCPSYCK